MFCTKTKNEIVVIEAYFYPPQFKDHRRTHLANVRQELEREEGGARDSDQYPERGQVRGTILGRPARGAQSAPVRFQ